MEESPETPIPAAEEAAALTVSEPAEVVIPPGYFAALSLTTFGIYNLWWMFKAWRYFREKERSDIYPAVRVLLTIVFGYELFKKIDYYANTREPYNRFNPGWVFIIYIIINLLARLPDPLWILGTLSFLPLLYPVMALNFYFTGSDNGNEHTRLKTRQVLLLVFGSIMWVFVFIGLVFGDK